MWAYGGTTALYLKFAPKDPKLLEVAYHRPICNKCVPDILRKGVKDCGNQVTASKRIQA